MAALASLMLKSRASLLAPSHSCLLESSRFASKRPEAARRTSEGRVLVGGSASRNKMIVQPYMRPNYIYFGTFSSGDFVHAGNILATQRKMRYHPGGHVGMGTNNTLYALEDGFVRFTKEVYIPPPRSLEATSVITKLPQGAVLYKTFINVLPVKQEGRFKLVDLV